MDMVLEVDKFGPVFLPRKLRDALHIGPGGKLHAHLDRKRMTVTPEPQQATVRFENGFPVIDLPGGMTLIGDPVAEARAEQLGKLNAENYLRLEENMAKIILEPIK